MLLKFIHVKFFYSNCFSKKSKLKRMTKHQISVAVLLLALATLISKASADDGCPEACWEQCFKVWFLYILARNTFNFCYLYRCKIIIGRDKNDSFQRILKVKMLLELVSFIEILFVLFFRHLIPKMSVTEKFMITFWKLLWRLHN
jgi:hypothetical protein